MKIVALIALLAASSPTLAADQIGEMSEPRCLYASLEFSPGAEVAIGNLRYLCVVEDGMAVWTRSLNTKLIPLCLHLGKLNGLGTVIGDGKNEVSCRPNGMWE